MKNLSAKVLLLILLSFSLLFLNCSSDKDDDSTPTSPTGNQSPYTPSSPSPAHSATNVGINPTLSWSGGDPDAGDTVKYDVYLWQTSAAPAMVSDNQLTTTYDAGPLDSSTNYSWYIYAEDSHGSSSQSATWTFTTEPDTGSQEGIFAALVVGRQVMNLSGTPFYVDQIVARFDSSYAPCGIIIPLQADSVKCGGYKLEWESVTETYLYQDPVFMPFITLGEVYKFEVDGSATVPDMADSIPFPNCAPYVTNIATDDTLPFTGFNVTWADYCTGSVRLLLMQGSDSTGVDIVTDNDGSYDFSQSDLSPLGQTEGTYMLLLIFQESKSISATGYDSRGFIWARTMNTSTFYMK